MSACSSDLDYGENMMNNSPEYTDSGDIYAYDSFGFFQLERYWTNDLYVEMDAPYYAKKVYYADGDHSAVVSSPGLYVSKWGPGPLIRHAPDYCPYDTSDMRYFFIPDQVQCSNNVTINGDNHIIINTENMYTVPDRIGTTYQCLLST